MAFSKISSKDMAKARGEFAIEGVGEIRKVVDELAGIADNMCNAKAKVQNTFNETKLALAKEEKASLGTALNEAERTRIRAGIGTRLKVTEAELQSSFNVFEERARIASTAAINISRKRMNTVYDNLRKQYPYMKKMETPEPPKPKKE